MNLQKLWLKWLIYTMIWWSIAWWFTWLINQTHWYQWEDWKNSQTVKWYQEYKWLKAFWWSFVPAVEKVARQKWITWNEMMKQIKWLLEWFLKQSNITQEQTRNWTILLAFAQDYLDAAWWSSSNNSNNSNTNNQVNDNLIRQREESIKKQREEEQNKIREQDYNKERNKDKIENWFDFNKNQNNKDDEFDYEKMTSSKYTNKSSVLKWILSNVRSDWNKHIIKWWFDGFVESYMEYKWMSESQAINAADEAFRTIYSYVRPWDIEWTLKWYISLRDAYNIQRSRSEWWWQSASETWVHWNWACQWKLNLSFLMLLMAWQDSMKMWFKNVWVDHVQLKIEWYSKYFDAVWWTKFDTWRHIWEAVSPEHYSADNTNQSSNQNTNTNNNASSQWQDTTENNNNWDISWGSYEWVNEFDFS